MDQISVLSMAQAVTEKRQNPPAAENSQTQSSFREMLADRRKALDKGGEEAFPTEKPEEENHGESTVSRTDSDMERMLWAAFMLMPASPEKQMPTPENVQSQGSEPLLILSETGTSGVQNELQKPQVSASDAAAAVETAQPQEQPLMRAQELERPAEVADTSAGPEQIRNADVEIKRADEPEQKPAYFAETPVFQEVSDIPIKVGETETVEQPGEAAGNSAGREADAGPETRRKQGGTPAGAEKSRPCSGRDDLGSGGNAARFHVCGEQPHPDPAGAGPGGTAVCFKPEYPAGSPCGSIPAAREPAAELLRWRERRAEWPPAARAAPRPAAEWAGFSASAAAGTRFPGRRNFFMERK